MRYLLTKSIIVLTLTVLLLVCLTSGAWAAMTAKANHDDIQMNLTYHGSTVSVSGVTDPGVDLFVKVTSTAKAEEKMMRKDKEAGFLWMNVEQIELNPVPEVYLIRSTKPPEELLDASQLKAESLGYAGLEENIEISPQPSPEQRKSLLGDFIKYKESLGVYSQSVGGIEINPDPSGQQTYHTIFDWPYQAPPGDYVATAYAVKNGKIVDKADCKITVEETGAVKTLDDMAQNNAALYGTLAIGVSLTAGFGVGLVFKGGGSH